MATDLESLKPMSYTVLLLDSTYMVDVDLNLHDGFLPSNATWNSVYMSVNRYALAILLNNTYLSKKKNIVE